MTGIECLKKCQNLCKQVFILVVNLDHTRTVSFFKICYTTNDIINRRELLFSSIFFGSKGSISLVPDNSL